MGGLKGECRCSVPGKMVLAGHWGPEPECVRGWAGKSEVRVLLMGGSISGWCRGLQGAHPVSEDA